MSQIHTSIDLVGSVDFFNENTSNLGVYAYGVVRSGYRFGGNLNFRIFDKKYIKTGIRYVRQGFVTRINNNNFSVYSDYIDEYYLEIPLIFRYEFNDKKFSPFIESGLSPHFYLKGRYGQEIGGVLEVNDYEIPYLEGKRIRMTFILALGFNYRLSQQYQFFLHPTFRYFFPFDFGTFQKVTTRNLGMEFGVRRVISFVKERD